MKKYVKPELFYEDFELSQHIAGCNLTLIENTSPMNCAGIGSIDGESLDGINNNGAWFVSGNGHCTVETDGYCYNNASFSLTTINS